MRTNSGKRLLDPGEQVRWWCPDCGDVKTKPQYRDNAKRPFHSFRCNTPMEQVSVTVTRQRQEGEAGD